MIKLKIPRCKSFEFGLLGRKSCVGKSDYSPEDQRQTTPPKPKGKKPDNGTPKKRGRPPKGKSSNSPSSRR